MSDLLDLVLLVALPDSGKSDLRRYIGSLADEQARQDMHVGPLVRLHDVEYRRFMRRIDAVLDELGQPCVYFAGSDRPFLDAWDWGTLARLVAMDDADLRAARVHEPASAARFLMERMDEAAMLAGARIKLSVLDEPLRAQLIEELEAEALELVREKNNVFAGGAEDKTVIVEFARGGPRGAHMPLAPPLGYAYAFSQLSSEMLERAVVYYVWVTPEQSLRKNEARSAPEDRLAGLHRGVPRSVMLHDYGCDDMDWLLASSGREGAILVTAGGRDFVLPAARFDNREGRTSFVRRPRADWKDEQVASIHGELRRGLDVLWRGRNDLS